MSILLLRLRASDGFYIIWLSYLLIIDGTDEDYFRNKTLRALI